MKDLPILFSGLMVRALLEGRKTETRRLIQRWLKVKAGDRLWVRETWVHYHTVNSLKRQDGGSHNDVSDGLAGYRADGYEDIQDFRDHNRMLSGCDFEGTIINKDRWTPSIHMPRWASRITLIATADARLEPLQDITEAGALAEGIEQRADPFGQAFHYDFNQSRGYRTARAAYAALWDSLNPAPGKRWQDNPPVVVLTFRVVLANIDQIGVAA